MERWTASNNGDIVKLISSTVQIILQRNVLLLLFVMISYNYDDNLSWVQYSVRYAFFNFVHVQVGSNDITGTLEHLPVKTCHIIWHA